MFLKDDFVTNEKLSSAEFQLPTLKEELHLKKKSFNGIGFWMDWVYDENIVSTGIQKEIELGETVSWNRNFKQGVYIHNRDTRTYVIRTEVTYNPLNGDVSFKVDA